MVVDGIMRLLLEGTADEVEYLGGDGCLSRLVVHERKLLKKVVGIVYNREGSVQDVIYNVED